MTLQGHPRSLILAAIESAYDFLFDLNSNLGPILPCFRDIRAFVCRKPLFSAPHLYSGENFVVFPYDVWVAKSEHPRLTDGEIIFEEFQPM